MGVLKQQKQDKIKRGFAYKVHSPSMYLQQTCNWGISSNHNSPTFLELSRLNSFLGSDLEKKIFETIMVFMDFLFKKITLKKKSADDNKSILY